MVLVLFVFNVCKLSLRKRGRCSLEKVEAGRTMLTRNLSSGSLLVAVGLLLVGCAEPKFYPVRGEVVIYGVGPLTEGEVQFRPLKRPDLVASGKVGKDGKFSASTPDHGEGVLEGDCQIAVIAISKDGKPLIAERYGDFAKSDRNTTVAARDENYCMIQVSKN